MLEKSVLNITLPVFDSHNKYEVEHSLLCNVAINRTAKFHEYTHISLEKRQYILPKQSQSGICMFAYEGSINLLKCDSLVTNKPGLALVIETTNSIPILLSDPINRVIAIVNATPQGLDENLIQNTISKMLESDAETKHIAAVLGPYTSTKHCGTKENILNKYGGNLEDFTQYSKNEDERSLRNRCKELLQKVGIWNAYNVDLDSSSPEEKSNPREYKESVYNVSIITLKQPESPQHRGVHSGETSGWQTFTENLTKISDRVIPTPASNKKNTRNIEKEDTITLHEQNLPTNSVDLRKQVDPNIFRKIKRGKISIESTLDLHGESEESAYEKTIKFILKSHKKDLRYLVIVVGKGSNGRAVIKTNLVSWLENHTEVRHLIMLATEALPHHGGEGAYYVFLRKRKQVE